MAIIDLDDLKPAIDYTPFVPSDDDAEMQDRIDAAEAEYAERVRPLPGSYTRTGVLPMSLPRDTTTVTATVGGASIPVLFDATTGMVDGLGFYARAWQVTVAYTVGPVPANHRDAVLHDVAELWSRTQRTGGGAGRPGFGMDPGGGGDASRPVTMWPRIRALAGPYVA